MKKQPQSDHGFEAFQQAFQAVANTKPSEEMLKIADDAIAFENLDAQAVVDELNSTGFTLPPEMRIVTQGSLEEQMTQLFGLTEEEIKILPSADTPEREAVSQALWTIHEEVESGGGEFKDTGALLRTPLPLSVEDKPISLLEALVDTTQHDVLMEYIQSRAAYPRILSIMNGTDLPQ